MTLRLLTLLAAATLFTGCSTTSPPAGTASAQATVSSATPTPSTGVASPQSSASPACPAASALAAALTGFKDTLKAGATLDQVRTARDQVVKSYDTLVKELGGMAKQRLAAITAAEAAFAAAVNDIPSDATLTDAIDSLRDETAIVQGAVSDLATEAKC